MKQRKQPRNTTCEPSTRKSRCLQTTVEETTTYRCSTNKATTSPIWTNNGKVGRNTSMNCSIPTSTLTQRMKSKRQLLFNRQIRITPPSISEISEAIRKLKNNKAPGTDEVPAELLKANPTKSATALHEHITAAWNNEEFPNEWKRGTIVKIPKKGDCAQCCQQNCSTNNPPAHITTHRKSASRRTSRF